MIKTTLFKFISLVYLFNFLFFGKVFASKVSIGAGDIAIDTPLSSVYSISAIQLNYNISDSWIIVPGLIGREAKSTYPSTNGINGTDSSFDSYESDTALSLGFFYLKPINDGFFLEFGPIFFIATDNQKNK